VTSGRVIIRRATLGDAHHIVAAVRAGFSDEKLGLFVYGCAGIQRYVECELRFPILSSAATYLIAEREATVSGCAVFRISREDLFLNYISVFPSQRGLGIGASLLAEGIYGAEDGVDRLALDVFEDNDSALRWYSQLGLAKTRRTVWCEVSPPRIGAHFFTVTGWPQAEACHEAFAFSTLTITTASGVYCIGRLGSDWFRITTADAVSDSGVWSALSAIDSKRRVLALVDEGAMGCLEKHRSRPLTSTLRLSGRVIDLRARLRR
jgi:ribosomal protein S18 acetylase RimI-like enzyme